MPFVALAKKGFTALHPFRSSCEWHANDFNRDEGEVDELPALEAGVKQVQVLPSRLLS